MPRDTVALTAEPIGADTVARAASAVHARAGEDMDEFSLRVLDEGAVLQVIAGDVVVLSVLRPRLVPTPGELHRLLPGVTAREDARWWTEAYTPWHRGGAIGLRVLEAAAEDAGGVVVSSRTGSTAGSGTTGPGSP